jgi:hypothetical protein
VTFLIGMKRGGLVSQQTSKRVKKQKHPKQSSGKKQVQFFTALLLRYSGHGGTATVLLSCTACQEWAIGKPWSPKRKQLLNNRNGALIGVN